MRPYPEYQSSNVEWLAEIPKCWAMSRLKWLGQVWNGKDQKPVENQKGKYPVYGSGGVFSYADEFLYNRPSVLMGRKGTIDKPLYVDEPFWAVDTMFYTKISKNVHPRFFYYLCKIIPVQKYAYQTTLPSMTQFDLSNIPMPQVELVQQIAIATYLDKKTAEIDGLIERKVKMIDLLREERAAIINHAVTKGIDPDVKLKPSGIDWIGDIPEEWEVKKLKWILKSSLKYGANESSNEQNRDNPRYIRITDFDSEGGLRDETFMSIASDIAENYLLEEGDILFARSGATVGKTFQFKNYEGKACFAGYLILARPNPEIVLSDFLYYFTRSSLYLNWKDSIFIQATIQNIGADKYQGLPVTLPPLSQQIEILKYLDKASRKIDSTISSAEREIELLDEYRTALISEVVTGKVDVREEASV